MIDGDGEERGPRARALRNGPQATIKGKGIGTAETASTIAGAASSREQTFRVLCPRLLNGRRRAWRSEKTAFTSDQVRDHAF